MAWTLFVVPVARRSELEAALKDDLVSRQSLKVRDASSAGGVAGEIYALVEGTPEAVRHAEGLLGPLGTKPPHEQAEGLYARFKAEDEAASAGMGLLFTE